MPSTFGGRGPLRRSRPRSRSLIRVLLVAVLVPSVGAACTPSPPTPPVSGSSVSGSAGPTTGTGRSVVPDGQETTPTTTVTPTTTPTVTPTAVTPTTTGHAPTSDPAGDFGTDHFVPFRTTTPNSAQGKRIGLIGLDQTNPFSKLVSESIKEQATITGAELVYCDAENSAEVALRCARRLASQGVDAWVTFQPVSSAGQSICGAGPQHVPMISIDGAQGNCQSTRVGTDDQWAGFTLGTQLGRFVQQRFDCRFDSVIYLFDPGSGFTDHRRKTGAELGLATVCPTPADRSPAIQLEASGQDAAYAAVGRTLTSIGKGKRVLIIGTNDGLTLGAIGAARAAGRLDDVYVGGIGADPRSYCEIATDPHWIGDAASFPERYGQLVIPYLVDLMDGKSVPDNLFVRNEFIDASTVAEHYDVSECGQTP